ncbi:MAG: hypothetical protein WDM91_10870 [Rhizomicrobium sp.]
MPLDKLLLRPQSSGYAVTPPSGAIIRSALPGGAGEYSADVEGGTSLVDVNWLVDAARWQYLNAFFRNRTGGGAEPFLTDLLLDGAPLQEYTAYFIPESLKLTGTSGTARMASAQFEVLPAEVDDDADSSIVDIFEASGGDMAGYLQAFADIIARWPRA